ncbi:hypothetical protein TcWFU_008229 [Taenia crassiceps]|uniref:Uncharacterized protein n=1 Tax=Taenia crassiceps TaxID=6207 RepID=A0ABR4Q510_9CEST
MYRSESCGVSSPVVATISPTTDSSNFKGENGEKILRQFVRALEHIRLPTNGPIVEFILCTFQDSLRFSTPVRPRSKSALLEVQIWAKWLPKKDSSPRATAFDTLGVPAPRFLGFLQLPLLELLRTAKSTDLPEAFHWACLRQDTSWEPTSSYDRFPVYPLFQPSVDNLNDNWIALSIGSSVPTTSEDDELMREFKVPRCAATTGHAALSWYSNAQANKGMPALCDTVAVAPSPTKVESFPAYVHLERANRLASDATRLDWTGVETFASFVVTDENRVETGAQRVVVTPLASNRVSPVWNYRRFVRLPLALVTTESKVCFHASCATTSK